MMPVIKHICFVALVVPAFACAATGDFDCLKNLSGSSSLDSNCYIGVAQILSADNDELFSKIEKSIPKGNKNRALLKEYMEKENDMLKFCTLDKQAGSGWSPSRTAPDVSNMFDVIYYECVYNFKKNQNSYLREILDSAGMNENK